MAKGGNAKGRWDVNPGTVGLRYSFASHPKFEIALSATRSEHGPIAVGGGESSISNAFAKPPCRAADAALCIS